MLTKSLVSPQKIQMGFHALSEPVRMKVLEKLRDQELCVGELCEIFQIKQSKLSFHLRVLKEAGLVRTRPEGRWIYYSLNLAQFILLEEYLARFRRLSNIPPIATYDGWDYE